MKSTRSSLSTLFLLLGCSSSTAPAVLGVATISGHVTQLSGAAVSGIVVAMKCPTVEVSQEAVTSANGWFDANFVVADSLFASTSGRAVCQFGAPNLTSPTYRADVLVYFSAAGLPHPVQLLEVRAVQ